VRRFSFWERLPFVARLLMTASLALVTAGMAMVYTSVRWDAREAKNNLQAQLDAELQTLPASLSELLVIGDFSTLQQTLDNNVLRPNIDFISYRDTSRVVLESHDKPVEKLAPAWFGALLEFSDLSGKALAKVGGRAYGTLEIHLTAQPAINHIWTRLIQHLSILLLAIALDFLGIWVVLRTGLKPLRALDQGARALEGGDFSVRIPLKGSPELRNSIAAFNRMAESLENLIAEQKRAQEELKVLNSTLEQRVDDEVARNMQQERMLIQQSRLAAMGEMIGNIAHQWRQPLNALGLLLGNIKDSYDFGELTREELDSQVATGTVLVHKMSTTIDDFRNFFRPNKEKVTFSLRRSLLEVREILHSSLIAHNIALEEDCPEDVMVFGYANEFAQALLNIVNNAREAILARHIENGAIRVDIRRENGFGVVRIRDNGGGIPEHILTRIFEPYLTSKPKGTGIGLYMAKTIIENNMDGRILVCNRDGGVEFTLLVPLASPVGSI